MDHNRHDIFRLAENCLHAFGQMWLLTAGPLIGTSVLFEELAKLQGRCHRVTARSRRDQDRERTLVLPHLFALLHWQLLPLWVPGSSKGFQFA